MARLLKLENFPQDWHSKYREDVIEELSRQYGKGWRKGLVDIIINSDRSSRRLPGLDETTSLYLGRLRLDLAMRLVNKVAFCYVVQPRIAQYESGNFVVRPETWLKDAIAAWDALCSETAMRDCRLPFSCVNLPEDHCVRAEDWLGLGMTSNIRQEETPAVREAEIDRLIEGNRRLCDLAHDRVHGLAGPNDEDHTWRYESKDHRMSWEQSRLMPTCRAVMMIATGTLTEARTVVLALTGDNDQLHSGPPTFADIPSSEIVEVRGSRAVEVTLEAAIWFLGCVEAAEETANEELRRINDARRTVTEESFHEGARDTVERFSSKDSDTTFYCDLRLREAIQTVLEREGL